MKIIDIAICVDNIDPKGMGRIRCVRYNDYVGEKENSIKYEKWSQNDPFIASPFLPNNINFIPENGQSVKLLNYNTDNENINLEYIAGPFTTQFDFNGQTFSQQIENTTYGVATKHRGDVKNPNGELIKNKSDNSFAKDKDFAIYGKYGSDLLFTENGLQLRGGKLLSKEAASYLNRETMLTHPLMADKSSRLYLKKFPKKMILGNRKVKKTNVEVKSIKTIVEYDIEGTLSNITGITLNVYSVKSEYGNTFKSNFFTESTSIPMSSVKLINTDDTNSTVTFRENVASIDEAYKEIRDKIFSIHDKGLGELNTLYENQDDRHPIFFRPKIGGNLTKVGMTSTEEFNKKVILDKISVSRVGPTSGLIWSANRVKVPSSVKEYLQDFLQVVQNSPEQTFATLTSDEIYFLSTDLGSNESENPINFKSLDKYDYTQEDYVRNIKPKTFSTVRGENLLRLLRSMILVIFTHRHNPLKPIIGQPDYADGEELKKLYQTLENDILNKSIRIN
jgi:hypothetical protein